ncbi:MAG: GNAT family N-acetyltransferase [Cyanobacteria bacterium P01_G01_bin.19]
MLNNVIFRPAYVKDASAIARLTIAASGGILEFLFAELVEAMTAEDILTVAITAEEGNLSYRNTLVAEKEASVIAIANSYSAVKHRITIEMRDFIPQERLVVLEDFFASRVNDSLFLNALSVKSEYRRQGIGKRLVEKVKQKARAEGFASVSLIVLTDNLPAISLYSSLGFEEIKQIEIVSHPSIAHRNRAKLMNYTICI